MLYTIILYHILYNNDISIIIFISIIIRKSNSTRKWGIMQHKSKTLLEFMKSKNVPRETKCMKAASFTVFRM